VNMHVELCIITVNYANHTSVSRNTTLAAPAPKIGLSGIRKDRVGVLRNYDVV